MKKLFSLLMAFALCVTLCACSAGQSGNSEDSSSTPETTGCTGNYTPNAANELLTYLYEAWEDPQNLGTITICKDGTCTFNKETFQWYFCDLSTDDEIVVHLLSNGEKKYSLYLYFWTADDGGEFVKMECEEYYKEGVGNTSGLWTKEK